MADAHHLVQLAESLTNVRVRRMRQELRERVGEALSIPSRKRSDLDCLQSNDVFLVFLPGGNMNRQNIQDHLPLLRQALVAACAATETYLADKVMENVGSLIRANGKPTNRVRQIQMSVGDWLDIEEEYERRRMGLRQLVILPFVRENASTASSKVGQMLSLIGVDGWSAKLDADCRKPRGHTVAFLDRVTERRNRIAHEGDRLGRGRAQLTVAEVQADMAGLEAVVDAIEVILGPTKTLQS